MAQEKKPPKPRRVEPHPLVVELVEALRARGYSIETGQSLLCGLLPQRVRYWKAGGALPRGRSFRLLAEALKNVKSLPIVAEKNPFRDRDLYRLLKPQITLQEREALLNSGDYETYRGNLRRLARDHGLFDSKPEGERP